MKKPFILGISGSLRAGSTNRKLLHEALRIFGDANYTEADLRVPLYDGDLEDSLGIPASVQTLADQIKSSDAIVISTPEYNKSVSGVLKNALDWVSRTEGTPWLDKPVAIMSAAAGRAGGDRSQFALRLCLVPFRPRVLSGPEVLIANARSSFDENERLTGEFNIKSLTGLMDVLHTEIAR